MSPSNPVRAGGAFLMSIELSRPGEAGLRGCSGWVAHAAGQGTWDKLPRTFSVEKTLGNWTKIRAKTVLLFFTNLTIRTEGEFCPPSKFGQSDFLALL